MFTPGWEVRDGPSTNPNTGPPGGYDPSGDALGNYTYVSSQGKSAGAKAELESLTYQETGALCSINFFYYMNGTDVGTLTLMVAIDNQRYPIWQRSGSQAARWIDELILLRSIPSPFQLIFEATMTGGNSGDIALDNIQLLDCSPDHIAPPCSGNGHFECTNLECIPRHQVCDLRQHCLFGEDENDTACSHIPYGARCDFESGLCGWYDIVGQDQQNWTRHHGSTKSTGTGPSVDHTLGTEEGYYIYYETSQIGAGHEAYIRSPVFEAPPAATRNSTSPLYEACELRFAYHMYGTNPSTLKVFAISAENPDISSQLFSEYNGNVDRWKEVVETIPAVITDRYFIQIEATRGRGWKGDVAVDDVSLSPECFEKNATIMGSTVGYTSTWSAGPRTTDMTAYPTPTKVITDPSFRATTTTTATTIKKEPIPIVNFAFTTCGTHGPYGPTQAKCTAAYRYSNLTVRVLNHEDSIALAGVQVWIVPETRLYSITAYGASGGAGVENSRPSKGAKVEAIFNLTAGDQLFILVGQEGESACSDPDVLFSHYCSGNANEQAKLQLGEGGWSAGGGGAGGGGTFIALMNENSPNLTPLLVAAGGGGLAFSPSPSTSYSHGRVGSAGPGVSGEHGASSRDTAGAGGGWNSTHDHEPTGRSFLQGATGGRECLLAYEDFRWNTHGGFGGGGGACTTGGGGGGYTGGNASLIKSLEGDGQGGMSFIHPSVIEPVAVAGARSGPGEVIIVATVFCPKGSYRTADKQNCLAATSSPPGHSLPISKITIIIILLVFIFLTILSICLVFKYKEHKLKEAESKMEASYQLSQLRNNFAIDVNPCYTIPGKDTPASTHDLKELPRENLRLLSALGQGAFGEVFRGVYQPPHQKSEIDIAVKTLPEHCTEQDELDFLMEALIMGNFEHPNVVSLLGVCFKEKPHFIVLEYMEGGELKQFLRDIRPTEEKPSSVKMKDLLQIAQDVAQGCRYLESRRFIHRDIAARNILLTTKEVDRVAKIADFGMARDIYRADYYRKGGQALLPVKWMPPEAFQDGIFTSKTDVWAYGVLLWEIISLGFMPYPGMSNQEVIQFVAAGERMNPPRSCPQPVFNLMSQCWRHIPEDRPSFTTVLESINYCLQDPDVLETPLPKVLTERKKQLTIMRPPDPKRSPVLRVEKVVRSREPSPCSSQRESPLRHTPSPTYKPSWAGQPSEGSSQQGLHHPGEGRQHHNQSPVQSSSVLLTNKSYGFSYPFRDSAGDAMERTCQNGFPEDPVQMNNLSPTRHVNETEQSGEMSTLLKIKGGKSSRSDSSTSVPGGRQEPRCKPDPTCKARRSASMRQEAPREFTKLPLSRGLSWSQRPSLQDNQNLQDADIHRSSSLPGIPVIVTASDSPSSDTTTLQPQLKSATNGSFSRAGSLKQKLSKKLSRDYRNTDSEPLVNSSTSEDNMILNKQSQDTFL
nr:leukocyte tyrosine kinase receptor-like [Lytechinus pictus]